MDQANDWAGLCAFCRRSHYDLLQPLTGRGWGAAWTFVANDVHAAEKAGQQMRRMGVTRLRHACRARLSVATGEEKEVAVITELPARQQVILDLETAQPLPVAALLMDESLLALEMALGQRVLAPGQARG